MQRNYRIEQEIFQFAPEYVRYVLFGTFGMRVDNLDAQLSARFQSAIASVRGGPKNALEIPEIVAWRSAFERAGINPSKFRPSLEALVRRALSGGLRRLSFEFVDVGTICSLEHMVPVGVHVLDGLPQDDLVLGRARGGETFQEFDGTFSELSDAEVIYHCGTVVLTRNWVWRQGRIGSVRLGSRRFAVNVDILSSSEEADVRMVNEIRTTFGEFGLTIEDFVRLSSANPEASHSE